MEKFRDGWDADNLVGDFHCLRISLVDNRDHGSAAGFDLFHVRDHFVVHAPLGHDEHARRVFVDKRDLIYIIDRDKGFDIVERTEGAVPVAKRHQHEH